LTGSCALVWSVTASGRARRARTSSGKISAALPSRPIDFGSPLFAGVCASIIASASSSVGRPARRGSACAGAFDARLLAFDRQQHAPAMVAASGCAPPMPPRPAGQDPAPFRSPP
jgi:hypothetical protein